MTVGMANMQVARHWWHELVSEVGRVVFRCGTSGLQMWDELVSEVGRVDFRGGASCFWFRGGKS